MKRTYSLLTPSKVAALIFVCLTAIQIPGRTNHETGDFSQAQLVSLGILPFQDDSGMNAPADLGQKIAKDLQQKLAVNYKDVLPRMLNAGLGFRGSGLDSGR